MNRMPDFNMNSSTLYTKLIREQSVPMALTAPSSMSSLHVGTASSGWQWHWHYIVYSILAWQTTIVFWKFWWKAPSNITIAAYPTPLGRWLTALRMIVDSESLLQRAYDSSNGKPFAIPMTDRWIVFVSDHDQLKQLESEPETVLSMEKALHELAFTEPILAHLQVPPEHKGPKSEAFRVMVGVLKNKLRSKLPAMSEAFRMRIREAIALEVAPLNNKCEQHHGDWQQVRLMPALLRIFTRVNLVAFVGEEQADCLQVYDDVMSFFWSCAKAFPILNLLPSFLLPAIGPVAMGWGVTRQTVYNLLLRITCESFESKSSSNQKLGAQGHITQWTAEMTRLRDAAEVAKITIGLLFASAFQVPMIAQFCIYSFCKYPEYQERLRTEAMECKDTPFGSMNQEMPYLDSFVKETARLSPGPIVSAPRTVMIPYTSPDRYHVPAGNWLAVPQLALMRDESVWSRGSTFEGFRFVDDKNGTSKSRLTHPSYEFPFWGSIRHACPARFYVSVVMKMILAHLIIEYEFKLADTTARPYLTIGKTRLPNPFTTILIRKRTVRDDC